MADLDALAIGQALADSDPRWGEPTGTARGLVIQHRTHARRSVVVTCTEQGGCEWICATVSIPAQYHALIDETLTALREAIWGDGFCYVAYPPHGRHVDLVGRADGRPAPFWPS